MRISARQYEERGFIRDQQGIVLPLVLVFLVLGALLITPTLGHGYSALAGTDVTVRKAQELQAADSGVEEALFWLKIGHENNDYWTWDEDLVPPGTRTSYVLEGVTVTVAVHRLPERGPNYYLVVSEAQSASGSTTVLSQVYAMPEAHSDLGWIPTGGEHTGDVYVDNPDGKAELFGKITGDVYVVGDLDLKSAHSDIDGDVFVDGDITLRAGNAQNPTKVTGNLCVTGNVTLNAHSTIEGNVFFILEDNAQVTLRVPNQAKVGSVFVISTDGSDVTLLLDFPGSPSRRADIIYYDGDSVTITKQGNGTYQETVDDWKGDPPPPECVNPSMGGVIAVDTYEIE